MVSNYACTTASASSSDEDDCWRLAEANNNSTALPAYNASSQTWTLDGRHAAPGEYIGGDISVAGPVYGAIKAGNLFSTSGDADVYGYVTGLAQRTTTSSEAHSFGNSTTFNLSDLPDGYDPSAGRTDEDDDDDPGGGGGSPSEVSLRWSRFL